MFIVVSKPPYWDLWTETKRFLNKYEPILSGLVVVWFLVITVLSITHPHLLPAHQLWFVDTFFFYFVRTSVFIGTCIYEASVALPPFSDFEPDETSVRRMIIFIVEDLPSFSDLVWAVVNFDMFIKELIFLFAAPHTERKGRNFIDRWVVHFMATKREFFLHFTGFNKFLNSKHSEFCWWSLHSAPTPKKDGSNYTDHVKAGACYIDLLKRKKSKRRRRGNYFLVPYRARIAYFMTNWYWNIGSNLTFKTLPRHKYWRYKFEDFTSHFQGNPFLALRFYIYIHTREPISPNPYFYLTYSEEGRVQINLLPPAKAHLFFKPYYIERIENDRNWGTIK